MRLIKFPPPSFFLTLVLFLFASLFLSGCKKTGDVIKRELPENISKQELLLWINNYQKLMPNGPKPILEQTLKTYYKGQMILKMPLSSGGGNLYFTKTDKLYVQFIRVVSIDNQVGTPFTGFYEFIDMVTYVYKKVIFKQGIRQAEEKKEKANVDLIQNTSTVRSTETWLGAFLRCLVSHIIAVPRRDINGNWGCFGLDGSIFVLDPEASDGGGAVISIEGGAGPGIDWFNWFNSINWPGLPPSYPDGGVNTGGDGSWATFIGDGVDTPLNPPNSEFPTTLNLTFDELDNMFGNSEGQDGEIINNPNLIEYEEPVIQRPLPKLSDWLIFFPKISNTQKMEAWQVYDLVGGSLKRSFESEPKIYENACAVRGSRALNYSDPSKPIPILKYGNPPIQITQKGADQKNYILNAVAFEKYMIDAYGDTPIQLVGNAANNFSEVFKLLKGKSGIYVIINKDVSASTGAGYSGHVDAIINGRCITNSYITPRGGVKSIRIWILND